MGSDWRFRQRNSVTWLPLWREHMGKEMESCSRGNGSSRESPSRANGQVWDGALRRLSWGAVPILLDGQRGESLRARGTWL